MNLHVLFSCDQWKSYASFKLIGVFTDEEQLRKAVKSLIDDKSFELDEDVEFDVEDKDWTAKEIHDQINYCAVETVTANEIQ
jgi:hypothetical protein